jgi:hypothetical protein
MKITVSQKAATERKPQNFCPWAVDEWSPRASTK